MAQWQLSGVFKDNVLKDIGDILSAVRNLFKKIQNCFHLDNPHGIAAFEQLQHCLGEKLVTDVLHRIDFYDTFPRGIYVLKFSQSPQRIMYLHAAVADKMRKF